MPPKYFITCGLKCHDDPSDMPSVVISEHMWYSSRLHSLTLAEAIAHHIAGTRNIAALWDITSVTVDGRNMTSEVKEAYDKLYVSRREEFLAITGSKGDA